MLTYTISDLAKEFNVTTRTLRYYEEKKLLNPSRKGQKRIYSHSDRICLKLVLRGKRLGFSLKESQDIISMYEPLTSNMKQLSCLLETLQNKKQYLLRQQTDLNNMIADLAEWEKQWSAMIHSTSSQQTMTA